jgi:hypothetical protein
LRLRRHRRSAIPRKSDRKVGVAVATAMVLSITALDVLSAMRGSEEALPA